MKHGMLGGLGGKLLVIVLLLGLTLAAEDAKGRTRVRISNMEFRTVRTPQFRDTSNPAATSLYEWLQVYVEYETEGGRRGWTDDISIDWSLLVRPGSGKPILLQNASTYVDVEDGKHHAVMYVRPGFIRRHCDTKNINKAQFAAYVEIAAEGQKQARQELSRGNQPKNWWRAKEPDVRLVDGELLAPEDTPFAPMDYDFYEHSKRKQQ